MTATSRGVAAADGVRLHLAEVGPADASQTLIIVHGYGEHGGRYLKVAERFAEDGYRVLIPDVRGHGQSGGPRGYVAEFGIYLDDLAAIVAEVAEGSALDLFGHSHGGLIGASWLLQRPGRVRRAVLSSPFFAVGFEPPAWKLAAAKVASKIVPRLSLPSEIDPAHVSRDPQTVADYVADPLNHKVNNARWATEHMAAQDQCFATASRLRVPTLVLQAGDDRIVSPEASRRWAEAAGDHARFELADGSFHEIFFDLDADQHVDRVRAWYRDGR